MSKERIYYEEFVEDSIERLERLERDVERVINVMKQAGMSMSTKYSLGFLRGMGFIAGITGPPLWKKTVAQMVRNRLEEIPVKLADG